MLLDSANIDAPLYMILYILCVLGEFDYVN